MMSSTQQMATSDMQDAKALVRKLNIVTAKDYVPGKEHEVMEAVRVLLLSSMDLMNQNIATAANQAKSQANEWFWNNDSGEEKKCDDEQRDEPEITTGRSGDFTTGEMDTIMDSMTFVLEVMGQYQKRAEKAASNFLTDLELNTSEKMGPGPGPVTFDEIDKKVESKWTVKDAGLDKSSPADFLLESFLPKTNDSSPPGSKPIDNLMPTYGATADMFLGSLKSLLSGITQDKYQIKLTTKLRHLDDIQAVSMACKTQLKELDSILKACGTESKKNFCTDMELLATDSMDTNSVVAMDKKMGANGCHPTLSNEASFYLQMARDKLSEYATLAENVLKDEIKCVMSEYTCDSARCTDFAENDGEGQYFEALRTHFRSDAYNVDVKTYLAMETTGEDEMEQMLLNILHSSLFLQNVGEKCRDEIRMHVGNELSARICNILIESLMSGKEKRLTQWGAILLAKHARALHAYIYEFCSCAPGEAKSILSRVADRSDAPAPMDAQWKKLFSALDILRLEKIADFQSVMVADCLSEKEVRKIFSLRVDLTQEAIDAALRINMLS